MKKVVKSEVAGISLESVMPEKFYGVVNTYNNKGIILEFRTRYYPICLARTNGTQDGWEHFKGDTLKECIKNIINNNLMTVFEFDTEKQLLEWLLK